MSDETRCSQYIQSAFSESSKTHVFTRLNNVRLVRLYVYFAISEKSILFRGNTRLCRHTSDVTPDASDNRCGRDAAEPL